MKFVEHRIADRRVVRLIQKWLNAGVLEDGKRTRVEEGTPQGGSASPLLANVYLHYVFDLWVQAWRKKQAHGDVIVVRYADDFVVGFQHQADAERFLAELAERFRKFDLELHPEKTRLLEFGRFAAEQPAAARRREAGDLQLSRLHAHLREEEEQRTVHGAAADDAQAAAGEAERGESRTPATHARPHPRSGHSGCARWSRGHIRYYGVPMNSPALLSFRFQVGRLWHRTLSRRSQNGRVPGTGCGGSSTAGCLLPASVIPIPCGGLASSPKARAGCGKAARPDLWRGL